LGMSTKMAVALAVCLTVRLLLAQEPAPAPGATSATALKAPELKDGNSFKYLGLPKNFPNSPTGKRAAQKYFADNLQKVISGQGALADSQPAFSNYYLIYYFPAMTQTTDPELVSLPDTRQKDFVVRHLEASGKLPNQDVHNTLISLALTTL